VALGVSLLRAFDFKLARAAFERAAAKDAGNPRVRALLQVTEGREHEVAGRLDDAQKMFDAAVATDPSCPEARDAIAHIEEKLTKPKRGFFRRLFFDE
jgi:Tfp pilus assembly protein PilF